MDLWRGWFTW